MFSNKSFVDKLYFKSNPGEITFVKIEFSESNFKFVNFLSLVFIIEDPYI